MAEGKDSVERRRTCCNALRNRPIVVRNHGKDDYRSFFPAVKAGATDAPAHGTLMNLTGNRKQQRRTAYVCQQCGYRSGKWLGRCLECGSWESLIEEVVETGRSAATGSG